MAGHGNDRTRLADGLDPGSVRTIAVAEHGELDADVIALVASNEARWATGQVFDATGGARI